MSTSTVEDTPPLGCFLPVLILAAYAAVHSTVDMSTMIEILLAAYTAVNYTDVPLTHK